jgi:hypothetical protein
VRIRYRGNVSTEPLPSTIKGFTLSRCLATGGGIFTEPVPSNDRGIFTESLPSNDNGTFTELLSRNDRRDTQTHIHTDSNVIS